MKHKIKITQQTTVSIVVEIEADSIEQAEELADDRYKDEEYLADFVDKEVKGLVGFEYFIESID